MGKIRDPWKCKLLQQGRKNASASQLYEIHVYSLIRGTFMEKLRDFKRVPEEHFLQ